MLGERLAPDDSPARPLPLSWNEYELAVMEQWDAILMSDPTEVEVQHFLERHPAMIPGGSGDIGPGGHHGSEMWAVFREPSLVGAGCRRRLKIDPLAAGEN